MVGRTEAVTVGVVAVSLALCLFSGPAVGEPPSFGHTSPVPLAATRVTSFMTLYGYADNSPPGAGIAHPCLRSQAGGTGTYADPITFATDVAELGWCTIIYVPYMERYFIHEDECSECDQDWNSSHLYRFDMWAGGDASSLEQPGRKALLHCESTWTRGDSPTDPANPTILINPRRNLPVAADPIFSPPTSCWSPIAMSDPGKQTTSLSSGAVNLQVIAADTAPGRTLTFSAVGLPDGLTIDATTGLISGTPALEGHSRVTITASDAYNSKSTHFGWLVKDPHHRQS